MEFKENIFTLSKTDAERAEAIAILYTEGIYIEDYSDIETQAPIIAHCDLIEQELLEREREQVILHIYTPIDDEGEGLIRDFCLHLDRESIAYRLMTDKVDEDDFANSWKKHYHPLFIGPFAVVPLWEDIETDAIKITLDPGMAFGHGGHETTSLCLECLADVIGRGDRVLDVGCGSGILAIAAKKLGADYVAAVDIDPVAVAVAKSNAELNNVEIDIQNGDLAEAIEGDFEVVCANIVASAIIALAPQILPLLSSRGVFISSGIIEERADEVATALTESGFAIEQVFRKNGWVALRAVALDASPLQS